MLPVFRLNLLGRFLSLAIVALGMLLFVAARVKPGAIKAHEVAFTAVLLIGLALFLASTTFVTDGTVLVTLVILYALGCLLRAFWPLLTRGLVEITRLGVTRLLVCR